MDKKIRIQKHLSQQGILSRRKTETYIQNGWVKVNGETVTDLGTHIDPDTDTITFSEEVEQIKQNYHYIALHKPKGIVTNCPQDDEKEIRDILPQHLKHLSSIGRLDKDSEGLILLTDDGIFAKKLLDPKKPHERKYIVKTASPLSEDDIDTLQSGVILFGNITKPLKIKPIKTQTYEFDMTEGKNRQIRRMVRLVDNTVVWLKRVAFGPIKLDFERGKFKSFNPNIF